VGREPVAAKRNGNELLGIYDRVTRTLKDRPGLEEILQLFDY